MQRYQGLRHTHLGGGGHNSTHNIGHVPETILGIVYIYILFHQNLRATLWNEYYCCSCFKIVETKKQIMSLVQDHVAGYWLGHRQARKSASKAHTVTTK